mgnify:CR=1 FL=1|tara:strand:+ start:115 stop:444 length:330 start_codon:yes stop_codon:yes gene_type:complete
MESYKDLQELCEKNEGILQTINKKNSILYFTASWCGPCKKVYPNLCKLNDNLDFLTIYKIDINTNENIVNERNIRSIPTFEYYNDNKCVGILNTNDINKICEFIKEHKE